MVNVYSGRTIEQILKNNNVVQRVKRLERVDSSPYDGIKFCSKHPPQQSFIRLIQSGKRNNGSLAKQYYRNALKCPLFQVYWSPLSNSKWYTVVRINPSKRKLTPKGMLELLALIFATLDEVHIQSFDEKVDIENISVLDVVKCLHVPFVRSIKDFECKQETFYYGKRNGQQVKVYNKAKQLGISQRTITRIEKTKKYPTNQRPTLKEFLQWSDSKALESLVMVGVSKIDSRTKLGKAIKKNSTLQESYWNMDATLKKQLKRHSAYTAPLINIGDVFNKEAATWRNSSFTKISDIEGVLFHFRMRNVISVSWDYTRLPLIPHSQIQRLTSCTIHKDTGW